MGKKVKKLIKKSTNPFNVKNKVNYISFKDSLDAWEGMNEFMFSQQAYLEDNELGGKRGPHIVSYKTFINIESCFMDQEFDFGKVLGYRIQKWTSLVNNYVDFNKLDILKGNVVSMLRKKTSNFNESMTFDNFHGSGKGCLLSMTCSRRYETKQDIVSFVLRSSEITRRLPFDLLLFQRMAEYIYGDRTSEIRMEIQCPHMYQNAEAFSLYHNHKDLYKLNKKYQADETEWGFRCMEIFEFMWTTHPDDIKFRAHKRSAEALQRANGTIKDGGYISMKAKDLMI